ncbi:MAG: hypothetical protein AB2A00_11955 [Myxococcota bacterium]
MGVPPNRIDILTSIEGVEFPEAWGSRVTTRYGDQEIYILSLDHLLQNKLAAGRPQDVVDADVLKQIKSRRQ